jgi:arylsulfatase A-like enzyme
MPPVVLLSVDSWRHDAATERCLPESTPILNADFARFDRCHSHGVATPLAFPGLVCGHLPVGDGYLPDDATTMAEALTDRHTTAFTNNGHLTARRGYDRGFERFGDLQPPDDPGIVHRLKQIDVLHEIPFLKRSYRAIADRYRDRSDDPGDSTLPLPYNAADAVSAFARRQLDSDPDGFVWAHYMDPHWPYHPDTAIDTSWDGSLGTLSDLGSRFTEGDASEMSETELDALRDLYEANVRYADRELADLLSWCRKQDWYDEALIAVVGDHGELFGENGRTFHPWDADPVDGLVRTPLFVKFPSGDHAGERVDHLVGHWDLLATVAREAITSDSVIPDHAYRLTERGARHVLSVSNTAIRVTEADGHHIVRRDGTAETVGRVSDAGRRMAAEASFPACRNNSGEIVGVDSERRARDIEAEREQQLRDLGYR